MCCMNVSCDNCPVNLEWTLIYQQKINPTQKFFLKKVHSLGYGKSSIKPHPPGGFISNTFEGGLNRHGGVFQKEAYLICQRLWHQFSLKN